MKHFFLLFLLTLVITQCTSAQKHAPRPAAQARYIPGIYPEGSTRMLRIADIRGLTNWDLKVMRNEIFARHGYIFKTEEMSTYFRSQPWYQPRFTNVEAKLSPIEKANVKFIQQYE